MAGTEVGSEYIYPGFSLHDDLAMFVRAGFTPAEALQAATCNPAKFLGMLDSLGTVEKGTKADLVLLEANPLDDISNTRRIHAVVVHGRYLSKETLRRMLTDAEARAADPRRAPTRKPATEPVVAAIQRTQFLDFRSSARRDGNREREYCPNFGAQRLAE